MLHNSSLLQSLLNSGQIALENGPFLATTPAAMPENWDFARVEGMLFGLAIGDGLGNTSESQLPRARQASYGVIRDYLPNSNADMRKVGLPSDDTQMAFWTLEQLLADGGLAPDHLAEKFTQHRIFGIGATVREFLRSYKDHQRPWAQSGQASAGNGALMRIAPVLIPHLRQPSPALWADAAIAGMITHNDRASISCCVAFTHILWECLRLKQAPEPVWWVDKFSSAASQLEGDTSYLPRTTGIQYQGPLWKFVDREVRRAIEEDWSVREACDRWYSGAYLLETMPCALYILAKHAQRPEEAIVRAVNDTKDNDTIAAIVGAAIGALHGRSGLPARWLQNLLGRTGAGDDWRIFELIEQAKQVFWKEDAPVSPAGIQEILAFLPVFERPGFQPGEWDGPKGSMPYFNYIQEVFDFKKTLYSHNFIIPFDWGNWQEAKWLMENPERVEKASLHTLRKLLTLHVRADRFSEGHLAHVFETGDMVLILKRLAEIQIQGRAG